MIKQRMDIGDDEIRIISAQSANEDVRPPKPPKRKFQWIVNAAILIIAVCVVAYNWTGHEETSARELAVEQLEQPEVEIQDTTVAVMKEKSYVAVRDTVVGARGLRILAPMSATPVLVIGSDALTDSSAVLVLQAADVRADNGKIAGAYVMRGDLLSRGDAKSGFCAIIKGEPVIGVADATPRLEEAIETEGYFFRQYPLVVGGQVVENRPKGRALRKALAEIDGRICVVLSKERLTFHDFSQALADAGARNAIYLVGGSAAGIYVDSEGRKFKFGKESEGIYDNVNYIVWR